MLNSLLKRICGFGLLGLRCGGDDNSGEEAEAYEKAVAPNREYQALMNEAFKNYYMPYLQDVSGMWNTQGKPLTEQLRTKLTTDLNTPWDESEMKSVYDKVWQQAQERTSSQWAPIEAQTSQRLAGAGALGTGAALKTGNDIQQAKYKSNESLAIEQAINEYNVKAQAKQQSYSNVFSFLNQTSPAGVMGQVGSYSPEVIPPYVSQEGESSNLGGLGAGLGALGGLGLAALIPGGQPLALMAAAGAGAGGGVGSLIKY